VDALSVKASTVKASLKQTIPIGMLSFPLAEVFNTKMYLKHENVFQIHKIGLHASRISITKYKLLLYKIHEMYFNYVFQFLYFNYYTTVV